MRPLTIHTRHFPPRRFLAITLFPFIFHKGRMSEQDIRHETIHLWQQATLLVVLFYVLYLLFWVVNLVRYRDSFRAYREIPFERSAYRLVSQPGLKRRTKAFDWVRRMG